MRISILALAVALSLTDLAGSARAQTGPVAPTAPALYDGEALLDEALAKVRPIAFNTAKVDWTDLDARLRPRARAATDTLDMLSVYRDLLSALGDGHSFVQVEEADLSAYRERFGESLEANRPRKRITSTFLGREEVAGSNRPLASGRSYRLVVVPAMQGGGSRANAWADALFAATVTDLDTTCGHIIDLRGNSGGNVWPMLLGLSPLLGDGQFGWSRDAAGTEKPYARIADGEALVIEGEYAGTAVARSESWRPIDAADRPVAVLFDDATASSGEAVAVAFIDRPNTRSFGQTTYGVASGNDAVPLSDGVSLMVTTAMMLDREGLVHPQGVSPDLITTGPAGTVAEAELWLVQQSTCH